ncbi:hypothetical protein TBLA_0C05040 [Henningerozyma blattae CBS 6284]|uniref:Uncharacterized protein n=1 Tax=Henningerozyma blattae (strain ATCC 34711 / CBS 6284 / DSM 70876 / NBRC 10599 / NRRL Y-10934 / UCD 77-7) TaxID=1071380 RepID=I2H1P8_HENB6|nr:hypothetical protein TBLA_0C05040 [Tetrapisispora blattae CBS 6284]CCH60300.1 hypothetical protein TBLA_0C05040 [Tetrapisispora blattae CBS 6284]
MHAKMDTPTAHQYVYIGRGGAGNIHKTDSKISPKLVPQGSQTPNILHPVFSTGRGGAGNMRKNVDPKLTRIAQDVGDAVIIPEDSVTVFASPCSSDSDSDDEDIIDDSYYNVDDDSFVSDTTLNSHDHLEKNKSISRIKSIVSDSKVLDKPNHHRNHKIQKTLTSTKDSSKSPPPPPHYPFQQRPVRIGRGGAGNLLSPTTSNNKSVTSNSSNSKSKNWLSSIFHSYNYFVKVHCVTPLLIH